MEFINIQMVDNMMVIGKMMKCQVKEIIYGKMVIFIKDNLKIIK